MKLHLSPFLLSCLLASFTLPTTMAAETSLTEDKLTLSSDDLTVTNLVWGGGDGAWDAPDAWSEDGEATSFTDNAQVTIGQDGVTDGGTITISQETVVSSLAFAGNDTWLLSGEGSLAASSISKDGEGDVTITTALTGLSGGLRVNEGSLILSSEASLGTNVGYVQVLAGAELSVSNAFSIAGKVANIAGTATFNGHVTTDTNFVVAAGGEVHAEAGITVGGQINAQGDLYFGDRSTSNITNTILKNGGNIVLGYQTYVNSNTSNNVITSTISNDFSIIFGTGSKLTESNYNYIQNGGTMTLYGYGSYELNSFTMQTNTTTGAEASLVMYGSATLSLTGSNNSLGAGNITLSTGKILLTEGGDYTFDNDITLYNRANYIDAGGGSVCLNGTLTFEEYSSKYTSLLQLCDSTFVIGDKLTFNFVDDLASGEYYFMSGITDIVGDLADITIVADNISDKLTLSFDEDAGRLYLIVGNIVNDLTWQGGSGDWLDSKAWIYEDGTAMDYTTEAEITFGSWDDADGTIGGTITMQEDVLASSMNFYGASDYTISGSEDAQLSINNSLINWASGTVTMDVDATAINRIAHYGGDLILNGDIDHVPTIYMSTDTGSITMNGDINAERIDIYKGKLIVNTNQESNILYCLGFSTASSAAISLADGVTLHFAGANGSDEYSANYYTNTITLGQGAVLDDSKANINLKSGTMNISGNGSYKINSMTMGGGTAKASFTLGAGNSMSVTGNWDVTGSTYLSEVYVKGDLSIGGSINKSNTSGNTNIYVQNGGSLSLTGGLVATKAANTTGNLLVQVQYGGTLALGNQTDGTDHSDIMTVKMLAAESSLEALDEVTNIYTKIEFSTTNTVNWDVEAGKELIYHNIITEGANIMVAGDGDVTLTSAGQTGASLTMGNGELSLTGNNSFTKLSAQTVSISDGGTLSLGSGSNVGSITGGTLDASASGSNTLTDVALSNTTVKVSAESLILNNVTLSDVSFESSDGSDINITASNLILQDTATINISGELVTTTVNILADTVTEHSGLLTLDLSMSDAQLLELADILQDGGTYLILVDGLKIDSAQSIAMAMSLFTNEAQASVPDEFKLLLNGTSYDSLLCVESYYDSNGVLNYALKGSIPEPSTTSLSLLALAALLARRRRK
ncbi:MAG: PEP-CTERM sorting domain-containing protein [Akkermansia sp.]